MSNNEINQRESLPASIKRQDYPSLFQCADEASLSAQQSYFRFQKSHLGLLILVSVVAVIIPIASITWLYSVLAILLFLSVIIIQVSRSCRYDKIWFDCRAIAESTKTAAWRFMMKAAPFGDDSTAMEQFISKLQDIRSARPSSVKNLAKSLDTGTQPVSDLMNDLRTKTLDERKTFYIENRLSNQKVWYSIKANQNAKSETYWSRITIVLQSLAVVLAIVQAASNGFPLNVIPVLMTLAAIAVAWSQMKRYGELAQTYSLAAQELGEQETLAAGIIKEADFLVLVEQVEENISREHTMWCARREVEISLTARRN